MTTCEPPSSFSIREGDENYCPAWRAIGRFIGVYLNGREQRRVIAYDCDDGWVRSFSSDSNGSLLIEDGYPVEQTSHGVVDARWIAGA